VDGSAETPLRTGRRDAFPELPKLRDSLLVRIAGNEGSVDGADGNVGGPIRVKTHLGQAFVHASLIGAERAPCGAGRCVRRADGRAAEDISTSPVTILELNIVTHDELPLLSPSTAGRLKRRRILHWLLPEARRVTVVLVALDQSNHDAEDPRGCRRWTSTSVERIKRARPGQSKDLCFLRARRAPARNSPMYPFLLCCA
jgi:hypothetical protein